MKSPSMIKAALCAAVCLTGLGAGQTLAQSQMGYDVKPGQVDSTRAAQNANNSPDLTDRRAGDLIRNNIDSNTNFLATNRFEEITAVDQVKQLGRGVNILGYNGYFSDAGSKTFKPSHFKKIHDAGFQTVRINMFTFDHLDEEGKLDPKWLARLDEAVDNALRNKLNVILDEHDFDECAKMPDPCIVRLSSVWAQLAQHYQNAPNSVIFELLNEPHGSIDAAKWNAWLPKLLAVVRQTNPLRNVVVGPTGWNSRNELDTLVLPEDDAHIIATIHYYDPFAFTHQGASWAGPEIQKLKGIRFQGTPDELKVISDDFDKVRAWAVKHQRPILLGEFGALETGAMDDRALWSSAVARTAESHDFAWAYWQFDSDFVVYDMKKQAWVAPILKALVPETK